MKHTKPTNFARHLLNDSTLVADIFSGVEFVSKKIVGALKCFLKWSDNSLNKRYNGAWHQVQALFKDTVRLDTPWHIEKRSYSMTGHCPVINV